MYKYQLARELFWLELGGFKNRQLNFPNYREPDCLLWLWTWDHAVFSQEPYYSSFFPSNLETWKKNMFKRFIMHILNYFAK